MIVSWGSYGWPRRNSRTKHCLTASFDDEPAVAFEIGALVDELHRRWRSFMGAAGRCDMKFYGEFFHVF
jgi:hypothetical protein